MTYYKIINIHPSSDRMDRLVSDTVFIHHLTEGSPAILVYVDENLEPSFDKAMRTSTVQKINKSDGDIEIVTMNNTYTLRELVIK